MIWAIVLTFIVTMLAAFMMFFRYDSQNLTKEVCKLRTENNKLTSELYSMHRDECNRRERDAYNQGVRDASRRSTQNKYRNIQGQAATLTDGEGGASK